MNNYLKAYTHTGDGGPVRAKTTEGAVAVIEKRVNNQREVGVMDRQGKWKTVTDASQVKVGDRVGYRSRDLAFGYGKASTIGEIGDSFRSVTSKTSSDASTEHSLSLFSGVWDEVQLFRHVTTTERRRVAKCEIDEVAGKWGWFAKIGICDCFSMPTEYTRRRDAIRGAKRFCASIGYECEIAGDK